jgi:hypothetical protein
MAPKPKPNKPDGGGVDANVKAANDVDDIYNDEYKLQMRMEIRA